MSPRQQIEVAQEGFAGGWNVYNGLYLRPNQYAAPSNVRLINDGDIVPRGGTRRLHDATVPFFGQVIRGGFSWRKATGTVQELIAAGGSLYTASYGVAANVPSLSSVSTRGAISASAMPSFAAFRDGSGECVYIADGQNGLSKWTGTTYSNHTVGATGVPFTFIWVYNQRLFGVTGTDQTLYWSALNNGDSLGVTASGGGSAVVRTFGAQVLIGGIGIGSSNFLLHAGALSRFTGTTIDDIAIDTGVVGVGGELGGTSPFAIVPLESEAFVLTTRGVYLLSEAGFVPLEKPGLPDPTIRDPAYVGGFATVGASAPLFGVHNSRFNEIWFGAASGSPSPVYPVYVFNYRLGCWVGKFDMTGGKGIYAAWETRLSNSVAGVPQMLFGTIDGYVRGIDFPLGAAYETYRDDLLADGSGGAAYSCSVQCRRLWTPAIAETKAWRAAEVIATLNGNTSVRLTLTGHGLSSQQTLVQPANVANTEPANYHLTNDGVNQFADATVDFSSDPRPVIHRVALTAEVLERRGPA